jgi:hypothetical protein
MWMAYFTRAVRERFEKGNKRNLRKTATQKSVTPEITFPVASAKDFHGGWGVSAALVFGRFFSGT